MIGLIFAIILSIELPDESISATRTNSIIYIIDKSSESKNEVIYNMSFNVMYLKKYIQRYNITNIYYRVPSLKESFLLDNKWIYTFVNSKSRNSQSAQLILKLSEIEITNKKNK